MAIRGGGEPRGIIYSFLPAQPHFKIGLVDSSTALGLGVCWHVIFNFEINPPLVSLSFSGGGKFKGTGDDSDFE